jgi:hypothetical protein
MHASRIQPDVSRAAGDGNPFCMTTSTHTIQLTQIPPVRVGMRIRRPPSEVFRAFSDPTGGFTNVLCALKALLEHGVELNVVLDHTPPESGEL